MYNKPSLILNPGEPQNSEKSLKIKLIWLIYKNLICVLIVTGIISSKIFMNPKILSEFLKIINKF